MGGLCNHSPSLAWQSFTNEELAIFRGLALQSLNFANKELAIFHAAGFAIGHKQGACNLSVRLRRVDHQCQTTHRQLVVDAGQLTFRDTGPATPPFSTVTVNCERPEPVISPPGTRRTRYGKVFVFKNTGSGQSQLTGNVQRHGAGDPTLLNSHSCERPEPRRTR